MGLRYRPIVPSRSAPSPAQLLVIAITALDRPATARSVASRDRLPDATVQETRERVRAAIRNSGFEVPAGSP
jgi:hypothetical protein